VRFPELENVPSVPYLFLFIASVPYLFLFIPIYSLFIERDGVPGAAFTPMDLVELTASPWESPERASAHLIHRPLPSLLEIRSEYKSEHLG
jgi:hypothetical protein